MSVGTKSKPKFSFGVIADVQYADCDDKLNFTQEKMRYYRSSLNLLRKAVEIWNDDPNDVSFIMNLGDTVDARNKYEGSKKVSQTALNTVVDVFKRFPRQLYHTWGNHDLCNFTTEELLQSDLYSGPQESSHERRSYYDFTPHEGFRCIILNNYEISMLGYPSGSPIYQQAKSMLQEKNKNRDLNSPEGLEGLDMRFVMFNGAMSMTQLQWLDEALKTATVKNEKVLLFGHVPIHPSLADAMCLQWNYDALLETIHKYNCVVAYFCGHTHEYNYFNDDGVHLVVMDGIIEVPPNNNSFATIDVYPNRLVMRGFGATPNLEMPFQ